MSSYQLQGALAASAWRSQTLSDPRDQFPRHMAVLQRGPDYRQLLADAQTDLDRQRKEADEHAALLREEVTRAQQEASTARSEARLAASGGHPCHSVYPIVSLFSRHIRKTMIPCVNLSLWACCMRRHVIAVVLHEDCAPVRLTCPVNMTGPAGSAPVCGHADVILSCLLSEAEHACLQARTLSETGPPG